MTVSAKKRNNFLTELVITEILISISTFLLGGATKVTLWSASVIALAAPTVKLSFAASTPIAVYPSICPA